MTKKVHGIRGANGGSTRFKCESCGLTYETEYGAHMCENSHVLHHPQDALARQADVERPSAHEILGSSAVGFQCAAGIPLGGVAPVSSFVYEVPKYTGPIADEDGHVPHIPNAETLAAMADAEVGRVTHHATLSELMDDLNDHHPVHNPSHYTAGGIETIDYLSAKLSAEEFQGFCRGNALKYLSCASLKGNFRQDLEKANWYIDKLLSSLGK